MVLMIYVCTYVHMCIYNKSLKISLKWKLGNYLKFSFLMRLEENLFYHKQYIKSKSIHDLTLFNYNLTEGSVNHRLITPYKLSNSSSHTTLFWPYQWAICQCACQLRIISFGITIVCNFFFLAEMKDRFGLFGMRKAQRTSRLVT